VHSVGRRADGFLHKAFPDVSMASSGRHELWKADTCFEIAFLRQSHYLYA
jgi:hypothetical protein